MSAKKSSKVKGSKLPQGLKRFQNLVIGRSEDKSELKLDTLEQILSEISSSRQNSTKLSEAIGFHHAAKEAKLFALINEAQKKLPNHVITFEILGRLWASAFEPLSEVEREACYAELTAGFNFFRGIEGLSGFLISGTLSSGELSQLLPRLRHRLGEDMYTAPFWNGLQSLAEIHPATTLAILETWRRADIDEERLTMSSCLLGTLRVNSGASEGFIQLEASLRNSENPKQRQIYLRSWLTTDGISSLGNSQFFEFLEEADTASTAEMSEAIRFLRCCLPREQRNIETFRTGIEWIFSKKNAVQAAHDQFFIIKIFQENHARCTKDKLGNLSEVLCNLLPINEDHSGSWREIEKALLLLHDTDFEAFRCVLFSLAETNGEVFSGLFRGRRSFQNLEHALSGSPQDLVFNALSSKDGNVRKLGFTLFEILNVKSFTAGNLKNWDEAWIALLIYNLRYELVIGEGTQRFFFAIQRQVERGGTDLKQLFCSDLVYECKNWPGSVFDKVKKTKRKSALLATVKEHASKYFEALRIASHSEVNSMEVQGYRQAAQMKSAATDKAMRIAMEGASPLMSMISKSYTLYGGTNWQTYHDGGLGGVTPMQRMSHSAELPRLHLIDPDGLAVRKYDGRNMVSHLLKNRK